MSNFPVSLDDSSSIPNPATTDKTNSPSHADLHGATGDAVKAVEAKLGIGATTPVANSILFGTGSGTSRWGTVTSAEMLAAVSNETGTGSLVFGTAPTLSLPKVDTIEESTPANGVTVDGMSIKDGKLNTNNSVVTANITDGAVTSAKILNAAVTPAKWTNPYKFSAYRAAAQTPANGVIQYDTEYFDTNNNFDITTNKGRYTAPVAGFYQLNVVSVQVVSTAPQDPLIVLMKNGATLLARQHSVNMYNGSSEGSLAISILVQLAAGDYVEVYGGTLPLAVTAGYNTFSGFLESET